MATTPRSVLGSRIAEPVHDRRITVAVIRAFTWTIGLAGVVWGTIYIVLGVPTAAVFPYGFSILSVLNWALFRSHGRLYWFSAVEVALILVVPVGLSLHLGGFMASGGVALWSMLASVGALLTIGPRVALVVFASFLVLTAVTVWSDLSPAGVALSPSARDVFFFLNVAGVSVVVYWATRIFLSANQELTQEQNRLREVERAYVAQEAMLRQRERLANLGQLSAGVAHELNNPAAAAGRATDHLGEVVARLIDDAVRLLDFGIGPGGLEWVRSIADSETDEDPLDRSDREDRLALWLERAEIEDAWELASDLAEIGFDADALESAAERFRRRQLVAALRWMVDVWKTRQLLSEVRTSTGRISEIVGALKGYSHMDRAEMSEVDVEKGIDDTLTVLRSKLGGIRVIRNRSDSLPVVVGHPGELNQVWTNLIANAAEAMEGSGTLTISVSGGDGRLTVEVCDDGPGVPADLVDRVFDPFVTTKAPGEGMGLGLNLTHQIVVDRHGGEISVDSEPGRTCFTVSLPAEGPGA